MNKIKVIFSIIFTVVNSFLIFFIIFYIYKKKITHLEYTENIIYKFINKKLIEINNRINDKFIEFKFDPFQNQLILYEL